MASRLSQTKLWQNKQNTHNINKHSNQPGLLLPVSFQCTACISDIEPRLPCRAAFPAIWYSHISDTQPRSYSPTIDLSSQKMICISGCIEVCLH